jgi:hypothetical protein
MGLWADMSEVERVAHSIRHGNKYHLKPSKAGLLEAAATYNTDVMGGKKNRYPNGTPTAAVGDPPPPPGVSQYIWDRVMANSTGMNGASIVNSPDVRDAIIGAGHEDWVKKMYESSMDNRAAHYSSNGADTPWANAQYDWYSDRYGDYTNDRVILNAGPQLTFGGGHTATYYPPAPQTPTNTTPPPAAEEPTKDYGTVEWQEYEINRKGENTPFMDSYLRARNAAPKPGVVDGLMSKFLEE